MDDEEYIGDRIRSVFGLEKSNWRYVSDPDDAPDDVNVEQGPQGGYRYKPGGGGGSDDGDRPHPNNPDEVAQYMDDKLDFDSVTSNAESMADSRREAFDIAMDEVEGSLESEYGDSVDTAEVMDEVVRRLLDEF